jgi:pimeloyl-ACP methyl ester carboxylesterase
VAEGGVEDPAGLAVQALGGPGVAVVEVGDHGGEQARGDVADRAQLVDGAQMDDALADQLLRALGLAGVPVSERRLDVYGVDTVLLEGGDGPPVVLLHGIASFAPEWALVIPRLVQSHRVVAADLPGLGESARLAGGLDAVAAVAWLRDLIVRTCAEPPTLVGHSVGGAIAAHFAIKHGELARRIVLVDSTSLGPVRPAPGLVVALMRYGARPGPETRDGFLRQVLFDPERARREWGNRWAALEAYDLDQAKRPDVEAATRELVRRIGARRIPDDQLRGIRVPVTLVWGRADRLMRFQIAEKASARFGWPLHAIDDCGHGHRAPRRPPRCALLVMMASDFQFARRAR